jgi:hypothetical protein
MSRPTLCGFCESIPTNHRCNHAVMKGGVAVPGQVRICGDLICTPCSSAFGNDEGVSWCAVHSNPHSADEDEDATETIPDDDKVDDATIHPQSRKGTRVSGKGMKSSKYTAKDL